MTIRAHIYQSPVPDRDQAYLGEFFFSVIPPIGSRVIIKRTAPAQTPSEIDAKTPRDPQAARVMSIDYWGTRSPDKAHVVITVDPRRTDPANEVSG